MTDHIERVFYPGFECGEVAVIDSDHIGSGIEIAEFVLSVQFEQHFHSEAVRQSGKTAAGIGGRVRSNEQYSVGSYGSCLIDLVFVDYELFAEQRQSDVFTDFVSDR